MRRFGQFLMWIGAAIVSFGAAVIAIHSGGPSGAIWLVSPTLLKLTMIPAGGLMICGAGTARIAHQREQRRLDAAATGHRLP
jgi:hypothetical protein